MKAYSSRKPFAATRNIVRSPCVLHYRTIVRLLSKIATSQPCPFIHSSVPGARFLSNDPPHSPQAHHIPLYLPDLPVESRIGTVAILASDLSAAVCGHCFLALPFRKERGGDAAVRNEPGRLEASGNWDEGKAATPTIPKDLTTSACVVKLGRDSYWCLRVCLLGQSNPDFLPR